MNGSRGHFVSCTVRMRRHYCWLIETLSHLHPAPEMGLFRVLLGPSVDMFHCSVIREDMSLSWTFKAAWITWKQRAAHHNHRLQFCSRLINSDWIWDRHGLLCHSLRISFPVCYHFIWLCCFWTGTLEKKIAADTGGLSSLAVLTTPLMAVTQRTRPLSVTATVQQSPSTNPSVMMAALVSAGCELTHPWVCRLWWKWTPLRPFFYCNFFF